MSIRLLFGPVTQDFAEQNLQAMRQAGHCLCFGTGPGVDLKVAHDDDWENILRKCPDRWRPDLLVLYLQYNSIPLGLWQAPVPIVGLAGDWQLLWHGYRCAAFPFCDLVLTDLVGVEVMKRAGIAQARAANLFGLQRAMSDAEWPEIERDIDVLFVGNFQPAVQRDRLFYLGRLATLKSRWNIVLASGVFGDDYRKLLNRAKIVFNRAVRGEANMRAFEAVAAGALLFQESGNRELPQYLRDREECVYYRDDDLEALLEHYLTGHDERERIARNGRARAAECTFERLWAEQVAGIEADWPALLERAGRRQAGAAHPDLAARVWQAASSIAGSDPTLQTMLAAAAREHPRDAALLNAQGVASALAAPAGDAPALYEAANAFQNAWAADPRHLVAGLNLAEVLVVFGRQREAAEQAVRVLGMLDELGDTGLADLDASRFPAGYDFFRVEWERAAWQNAGDRVGETHAKSQLLRWRLRTLLAELTRDPVHAFLAVEARPDLPATQAGLGYALAQQGRLADAIAPLERAVNANPFDRGAARALYETLGLLGRGDRQQALVQQRRLVHAAAPGIVPEEAWFEARRTAAGLEIRPTDEGQPLRIVWQGAQDVLHSLALVNRNLCARLVGRGHELSLLPQSGYGAQGSDLPLPEALRGLMGRCLSGTADVHVTHQWPPELAPPREGRWVVIQPWEFGSIPTAWLAPLRDRVDELWVPTAFVRDCFIRSGVPAFKIHVVPNGVTDTFLAR